MSLSDCSQAFFCSSSVKIQKLQKKNIQKFQHQNLLNEEWNLLRCHRGWQRWESMDSTDSELKSVSEELESENEELLGITSLNYFACIFVFFF